MRILWIAASATAAACIHPLAGYSQEYPSKPIRYMVPFGAGGPTDTQARFAAQRITAAFGQQVIVENRPAAGGVPGTAAVAKAPADGYTLLAANPGPLTVAPAITASLPYDTLKDFAPVALVARTASVLVVHPSMPARSVREFIAYARSNPGKINYGTPGVGTVGHLTQEFFAAQTGMRMTHIPYKGGVSQYTVELMAGYIDSAMLQIFSAVPFVKQGKIRALGVSSRQRSPALPDTPTIIEQGVAEFESYNWNGVLAPARTPPAIIAKLHAAIAAGIQEHREMFIKQGQEPVGDGPEPFAQFIRSELVRYDKVARLAGISKQ